MRRRDRYANLIWFAGWEGDPHSREHAARVPQVESLDYMVDILCGRHGYFLEVTPYDEGYELRLFPYKPLVERADPPMSFLYKGISLRNVLASAVEELAELRSLRRQPTFSTKEVCRWVP